MNISRRDFLKLGASATLGMLISGCKAFSENPQYDMDVVNRLGELMKKRFGTAEIIIPTEQGTYFDESQTIRYSAPAFGYGQMTMTMEAIYREFTKYPPEFFEQVRDTKWGIVLGTNMEVLEDSEWLGIGGAAVVSTGRNDLFVNIGLGDEYSKRTTHHEWYHNISDNAPQIIANPYSSNIDDKLASVNARYKLDGNRFKSYKEASSCKKLFPAPPEGFEECYGQWNPNEDGATLAEALMIGSPELWRRMETDRPLKEKALSVIDMFSVIDPRMNAQVFSRIKNGERDLWDWQDIPKEIYNP